MPALAAPRNTTQLGDRAELDVVAIPVKASTTMYAGGIVCVDATGYAVPGATATGLKTVGRAEETVVNTGASGAKSVRVRRGVFKYANSAAGDAIAQAEMLADVYIVDDQTVAKTNGTNTRSKAGTCMGVESDGVWVKLSI